MSRHLYTLATIAPACDTRLRALLEAPTPGSIIAAEDLLLKSLASDDALVGSYRCLLSNWRDAHVQLREPIREVRPSLLAQLAELDARGWTTFAPDDLEGLPEIAPIRTDHIGADEEARDLWLAIRRASRWSAVYKCPTIFLHRALGSPIDTRVLQHVRLAANGSVEIGGYMGMLGTCPACGHKTVSGEHEICHICGWQDDWAQRAWPDMLGANSGVTLRQAQRCWRDMRVSVPSRIGKCDRVPDSDDVFNPMWRPLSEQ